MLQDASLLRIGCIHSHIFYTFWATIAQGINDRAAELGLALCLPQTLDDDDKETAVAEVIEQHPQVVLLTHSLVDVYPEAFAAFHKAGIPLIGVEMTPNGQCLSYVRTDETQGSQMIIRHLFERMGGQGKVVHIAGRFITERQTEFERLLPEYPGIRLAYEGNGNWSGVGGAEVMRAALDAHPDIRGVFAHNDDMAIGAAQVIAERGLRDQIVVVGFDAVAEGLLAIRDGQLAATIYRGIYHAGRQAVDTAVQVARGQPIPELIALPTTLITSDNLVDATLDTTTLLPGLLRDMVNGRRAQYEFQQAALAAQQATLAAQQRLIHELSTPIIPISNEILIMPLIGSIGGSRANQIMEAMLNAIVEYGASFLIVDITGMTVVDTAIANHLLQAARAVQLLGAQVILVGIRPEMAQTFVGLGVDLGTIITHANLQTGLAYAQQQLAAEG